MLAVSDGSAAIAFYRSSFEAELFWKLGEGADLVPGLAIDGAKFFLAKESPEYGTQSPNNVNFTTVRIELFVDDPFDVHAKAVAAGATNRTPPVAENRYDGGTASDPKDFARLGRRPFRPYMADRQDSGVALQRL